jgi:hypothetical protein
VLAGSTACSDDNAVVRATSDHTTSSTTYAPDQVYAAPITDLVGQRIDLRAPVAWTNALPGCVGDDPDCPGDKYLASPLTVSYENGDDYVPEKWHGQHRGDIRIVSDAVTSEFNKDNAEEYYFNGELLSRDAHYVLTGVIAYRDWIGGGVPPVDNPDFIAQSNQVTYWSQTFEFRVENVQPAPSYRVP